MSAGARLALLLLAAGAAFGDRLPPVDESGLDPSFAAFKAHLLNILEKRDVAGLVGTLDPGVRVTFGDDGGIASFRRHWKLDRPAESRIWAELATVLKLGVTREENEFVAPYIFTRFPHNLDAYTYAAVVRSDTRFRGSTAPLDHDLVEIVAPARNGWVEVRTLTGLTGFLQTRDIRSPLDYRAFFEKKNGQWKLTAFIKGD